MSLELEPELEELLEDIPLEVEMSKPELPLQIGLHLELTLEADKGDMEEEPSPLLEQELLEGEDIRPPQLPMSPELEPGLEPELEPEQEPELELEPEQEPEQELRDIPLLLLPSMEPTIPIENLILEREENHMWEKPDLFLRKLESQELLK